VTLDWNPLTVGSSLDFSLNTSSNVMNTRLPGNSRWLGALLVVLFAFIPTIRADLASTKVEPKDRTIYQGLDIMIRDGDLFYKVLDVSRGSATIAVNGHLKLLPFSKLKEYRLKRMTKVGGLPVDLANLVAERTYTPENDPTRIWAMREIQLMGYMEDMESVATGAFAFQGIVNLHNPYGHANAMNVQLHNNLEAQFNGENKDAMNGGWYARKMQEDLDKEQFDALQVDFEVSSPETLESPYVVVVTEFREKAESKETSLWIVLKPLLPIRSKSSKVHIVNSGMPPGYALGKCEVHLYNQGREIPTTVSERKMVVTRTEVYLYSYLSNHKNDSLPAAPMRQSAPPNLRDAFSLDALNQFFKVEVSPRGEVVDLDATDTSEIASNVQSLWKTLRFYPALENGKPVATTVETRLADFIQ
jgi:hypothetical protein